MKLFHFKQYTQNHRGFTLIELLVVISIIGLLSSVVLASLSTTRSKARDVKRISDMHQIQNALELYKSNNGVYPPINTYPISSAYPSTEDERGNSCFIATQDVTTFQGIPHASWGSTLNVLTVQKLISKLPSDPQNNGTIQVLAKVQCYAYTSNPAGPYASCISLDTGLVEDGSRYEYALYANLENPPSKGYAINWKADFQPVSLSGLPNFLDTKPYNYCILGPRK